MTDGEPVSLSVLQLGQSGRPIKDRFLEDPDPFNVPMPPSMRGQGWAASRFAPAGGIHEVELLDTHSAAGVVPDLLHLQQPTDDSKSQDPYAPAGMQWTVRVDPPYAWYAGPDWTLWCTIRTRG